MTTRLDQSTSRPPPSSPSLLALLELVPPSPVLSVGDLITSLSSGEIPIFFHDDTHATARDSLYSPDRLSPLKVAPRAQQASFSKPMLQSFDNDSNGYLEDPEAAVASERSTSNVDTTENVSRNVDTRNRLFLRWSSCTASGVFVRDCALSPQETDSTYADQARVGISLPSQISIDPSAEAKQPICTVHQEKFAQTGATLSSQVVDVGSEPPSAEGNLKGDLSSAPRGARSISYKESGDLTHENKSEINKIDPNQSREMAMLSLNPATSLPLNLARYPYSEDCIPISSDQSQDTDSLAGNFNLGVDALNLNAITSAVGKDRQLAGWLQNTTITLSIDQEGLRTVRPTFKPIGITRQRLSGFENAEIKLIAFTPTEGHRFPFRYSLLDNHPILRRLIINGDETKDYLSRQASLDIRSNGFYSVHGVESVSSAWTLGISTGNSRPSGLTKLFWQFDYIVEDRKPNDSGRVQDGEKTLTPLMFLCSSQLLHPSQGKKIKLTHVVRKTVAMKLLAEKTETHIVRPQIPASKTIPEPGRATNIRGRTSSFSIKNLTWNLHRRTQSNSREGSDMSGKILRNRNSIGSAWRDSFILRRRRRASSTGYNLAEIAAERQYDEESAPVKHTLSFSRLRQLLREGSSEGC